MRTIAIILTLIMVSSVSGQVDSSTPEVRPWYSLYLNKKINHRWSVDAFSLLAMRSMKQDFWLTQVSLGANYRVNRFWTLSANYGHSRYKHTGAWWNRNYPDLEPGILGTVAFQSLGLTIRRTDRISERLRLTNRIAVLKYFPRFQKFGTRVQLTSQLNYVKRDLPFGVRPFVSGAVYYYMDGVPVNYYNEGFEVVDFASADGLHRYRIRIGVNFRPVPTNRRLSMNIYYGVNREFNGSGNDLNFLRPSSSGERFFTTYPFNNYNILGIQANYFLR